MSIKKQTKASAPYHHGNLRKVLLGATSELVEKKGLEAVSLRAIARHIGVSHGAPANHFKNKQALMTAYMAGAFEDVVTSMTDVYDENDDLETRFLKVADALVNYAMARPNTFSMMIRSEWFDVDDPEIEKPRRQIFDLLLAHMDFLNEAGHTSKQSNFTRAVAAWSIIHGYASLRNEGVLNEGIDEKSNESQSVAVMKIFLHGLMSG